MALVVDFLDRRLERISGRAEDKSLGRTLPDIGNTEFGHTGTDAGLRSVSMQIAHRSFHPALPPLILLSPNYMPTPLMKTAQTQHVKITFTLYLTRKGLLTRKSEVIFLTAVSHTCQTVYTARLPVDVIITVKSGHILIQ